MTKKQQLINEIKEILKPKIGITSDKPYIPETIAQIKRLNGVSEVTVIHDGMESIRIAGNRTATFEKCYLKVIGYGSVIYLSLSSISQGDDQYVLVGEFGEKYTGDVLTEAEHKQESLFTSLRNTLKDVTSFKQIVNIAKKYTTAGLGAAAIIMFLLCKYNFNDLQRMRLADELNYDEVTYSYSERVDPEWELLSDKMTATVYNMTPEQCNADCTHTASMFVLDKDEPELHRIIAMDRGSMNKYGLKYGTLVRLEGCGDRDGVYQIQDTMNKRYNNMGCIDILVDHDTKFGKWDNVKVYKLANPADCYSRVKEWNHLMDAENQEYIDSKQHDDFH